MIDPRDYDEREPADHMADTNPMQPVRLDPPLSGWRRALGCLSLIGALVFTVGSVVVWAIPTGQPLVIATDVTAPPTDAINGVPTADITSIDATADNPAPTPLPDQPIADPTISPDVIAARLSQPPAPAQVSGGITFVRNTNNPFTLVPDRPRIEVIQYEVVSGDTMFSIAERFGIQPESIAWSNPRNIIGGLRPGMMLNIPPADGAVELIANDRTIADLAAGYGVDPFAIIDWESNGLTGASPDTLLRSGVSIFVPGGQAEQISWAPRVERSGGDQSGSGGTISFAPGEPGSCGQVANPGGFGSWTRPMSNYSWVRGFTSFHTGVDLSAPVGTPVSAALGGTVIFRGWNSFGYGYTVVLAHGPFTTLYGHLSEIYVGCGQSVAPGTVIAGSGNSGNSSGPHLHFEIRFNDIPTDPTGTMGF
ncbi:MAG: peptidoglycan DD-metalloendopeptidase family protein [Chloroflexota bacterium]|nr:peptidoglycan DD-metalloendopeptidase family protein [Chloroflexota bacterium]